MAVSNGGKITGRTRDYEEQLKGAYHGFETTGGELIRLPYEYPYMGEPMTTYCNSMNAYGDWFEGMVGANYVKEVVPGLTGGTGLQAYGSKWSHGELTPLFTPLNEEETEWWAPEGFDPTTNIYNVVGTAMNGGSVIVGYVESKRVPKDPSGYRTFIIRYGEPPRWLEELLPCNVCGLCKRRMRLTGATLWAKGHLVEIRVPFSCGT